MAAFRIIDGPYQGVAIDHNDVNLYCSQSLYAGRKFIFMPPRHQWEAIKREEIGKDQLDSLLSYELVRTARGVELHFDGDGARLTEAMHNDRQGIRPPPPPFTGAYFRCVPHSEANLAILEALHPLRITDEKGRSWLCIMASREEGESGPPASVLRQFGKVVLQHCNDASELPFKLSDILD